MFLLVDANNACGQEGGWKGVVTVCRVLRAYGRDELNSNERSDAGAGIRFRHHQARSNKHVFQ